MRRMLISMVAEMRSVRWPVWAIALIGLAGCASNNPSIPNTSSIASSEGIHPSAIARLAFKRAEYLEAATYQLKTAETSPTIPPGGADYCWAGWLFTKAEKLSEADGAARRGLAIFQQYPIDDNKAVKPGERLSPYDRSIQLKESGLLSCRTVLAQSHAMRAEWDPVRSLGKEYLTYGRLTALSVPSLASIFQDKFDYHNYDAFILADMLQSKDRRLAADIRAHLLDFFPAMKPMELSSEYANLGKEYAALGDGLKAKLYMHRAGVIRQVDASNPIRQEEMSNPETVITFTRELAQKYRALGFPEMADWLDKELIYFETLVQQKRLRKAQ